MDFPFARGHKPTLSTAASEMCFLGSSPRDAGFASTTWPTANKALFVPFSLHSPFLVKKVFWVNGTAVAGTVDCGVYTLGGARLLSAGPQTQAGTSVIQSFALTTAVLLTPGTYYMALACSSTSATIHLRGVTSALQIKLGGIGEQGSASTLPDPATIVGTTAVVLPLCGITNAVTI